MGFTFGKIFIFSSKYFKVLDLLGVLTYYDHVISVPLPCCKQATISGKDCNNLDHLPDSPQSTHSNLEQREREREREKEKEKRNQMMTPLPQL